MENWEKVSQQNSVAQFSFKRETRVVIQVSPEAQRPQFDLKRH